MYLVIIDQIDHADVGHTPPFTSPEYSEDSNEECKHIDLVDDIKIYDEIDSNIK